MEAGSDYDYFATTISTAIHPTAKAGEFLQNLVKTFQVLKGDIYLITIQ